MKTPGGNASSNAAVAVLTGLFEHLIKARVITPEVAFTLLADAIERLKNSDAANRVWLDGAIEAINGIAADLAKIGP